MLSIYLSMVETAEDNDKITFIYTTYYSAMAYSARMILGDNEVEIEDVVHDSMVRIIEILPRIDFSEPKKLKGLCCIIARNLAIDRCKDKENQNIIIDDTITEAVIDESCPVEMLIRQETYDEVMKAIYSLDDKYRDICAMKYVYRLKEKDIATALGLPPGTVSVRIQRGRHIIKSAIGKGDIR